MYSEIKQYLCILFKQDSERCFLCDAEFRILRMMIIKKKKNPEEVIGAAEKV